MSIILPTRTILAIAAVIDIATHQDSGLVKGDRLAERLELQDRSLEAALQALTAAGVLASTRGRNGGYKLAKPPEAISFNAIVDIMATVSNVEEPKLSPAAMHVAQMVDRLARGFLAGLTEWTIAEAIAWYGYPLPNV